MDTLTFTPLSRLRQEVAARMATLGPAWSEAPVPFDRFDTGLVPSVVPVTKAHGSYAVGVPDTPDLGDRQNATSGTLAKTTLRVRFFARSTPSTSGRRAEDDALDLEQQAIAWLMEQSVTWPGSLGISLRLTRRQHGCPAPFDWFVHDLTFEALHRLALK